MDGRSTAREVATRARMLMETANATHVANWGLNSLYAVTFAGCQRQMMSRLRTSVGDGTFASTRLTPARETGTTARG
jgi:hypothetical protein